MTLDSPRLLHAVLPDIDDTRVPFPHQPPALLATKTCGASRRLAVVKTKQAGGTKDRGDMYRNQVQPIGASLEVTTLLMDLVDPRA